MAPNNKLFGPKQIVIISVSGLIGTGFFLYRRYYETGTLGWAEFVGATFGVVMLVTVTYFIARKANRGE